MDSYEYKEICRICLEDNVLLDWNTSLYQFHDTTYKDCYYKFTQLECNATDPFPQMLCQNCCKALHNTYTLILKALESQKVLQDKFSSNSQMLEELTCPTSVYSSIGDSDHNAEEFETILVEEIEIEPILDDNFEYEEGSDEDISVTVKAPEKTENKNNYPSLVVENTKTKRKTEQSVKTKNIFKEHLKEPSNNLLEMNVSSIKSENPISDEEQIVECNAIDYNLIDDNKVEEDLPNGNKTDEKEETTNVEPKAKKNYENEARICSICSKILTSKRAVALHERTHVENRERNKTCKVCGLKFYTQMNLYGHMLTHKEGREKQHKCEFCSKAFYNKGALNVHRRIHLGQMIPCNLCSKQYYRQIDLDKHMSSHSATAINSDIKKRSRYFVRCPHCDKSILSTTFKTHTAAHLNEPLMKCTICDKEFFRRKNCVLHVKKVHQKTNEYNDFIVKYEKNRISHLYLKQHADVQHNND